LVAGAGFENLRGLLSEFGAVADHEEVIPRCEAEADHLVESVVVQDRPHVEVVGHDESAESHLFLEESRGDRRGERGGHARGIEFGEGDVADHHAVDGVPAVAEFAEDLQLMGFQFCMGAGEGGEFVMRVAVGAGVSGEVFAAGEDPCFPQGLVENAGHLDHLVGTCPVAAPAQGVVGLVVESDVEHGTEVEVESEEAQEIPGQFTVPRDEGEIPLVAELAGVRRFVAEELEAGDAASLLIDRDDRLRLAEFAQAVGESAELGGLWMLRPKRMKPPAGSCGRSRRRPRRFRSLARRGGEVDRERGIS